MDDIPFLERCLNGENARCLSRAVTCWVFRSFELWIPIPLLTSFVGDRRKNARSLPRFELGILRSHTIALGTLLHERSTALIIITVVFEYSDRSNSSLFSHSHFWYSPSNGPCRSHFTLRFGQSAYTTVLFPIHSDCRNPERDHNSAFRTCTSLLYSIRLCATDVFCLPGLSTLGSFVWSIPNELPNL